MYSLQGALDYLGRRRQRFFFMSAAAACTIGTVLYVRKQYYAMTAALDAERANGARNLRAVYLASNKTVEATLRALLSPGRDRVFACSASNPDALVASLKTLKDESEKRKTWESLKIAAIVRLVASVYYLVEVHLILLVQVNLIARYSTADADAPIDELVEGKLNLETKQEFLSLARQRLFEQRGIEQLVEVVEEATNDVAGSVKLTKRVGPDDVRNLLRQICRRVEARSGMRAVADADAVARDVSASCDATSLDPVDVLSAPWLLTSSTSSASSLPDLDASDHAYNSCVSFLVKESLDLCDVLEYNEVLRKSVDALMDVAGGLVDASLWGVSSPENGGKVAFAPVIARIANVSKLVLDGGQRPLAGTRLSTQSADSVGLESPASGPFVDALLEVSSCDMFGAAVFLSGERSSNQNSRVSS